jgi:hypothetical protein
MNQDTRSLHLDVVEESQNLGLKYFRNGDSVSYNGEQYTVIADPVFKSDSSQPEKGTIRIERDGSVLVVERGGLSKENLTYVQQPLVSVEVPVFEKMFESCKRKFQQGEIVKLPLAENDQDFVQYTVVSDVVSVGKIMAEDIVILLDTQNNQQFSVRRGYLTKHNSIRR